MKCWNYVKLNINVGTTGVSESVRVSGYFTALGVPRRQSHRHSGMANLPSVGAIP